MLIDKETVAKITNKKQRAKIIREILDLMSELEANK
jgi:EAL domain-containing protein (putative c-di-GMP-specific phosphodiesterase class I)